MRGIAMWTPTAATSWRPRTPPARRRRRRFRPCARPAAPCRQSTLHRGGVRSWVSPMVTLDRFKRDTLSRDDLLIIPERRRIGNDDVSPRRNAQPAAVPPTPVFSAGSLLQRPHLLR